MNVDWQRAEEFFLEAAGACWPSGRVPKQPPSPLLLGAKVYLYPLEGPTEDGLRYADCFWVGTGDSLGVSFGFTLISKNDVPIWRMQYEGFYPEGVGDFVKKALREEYEVRQEFRAGRGPIRFIEGEFLYENLPRRSKFLKFYTREKVLPNPTLIPSSYRRELGHHVAQGGALV
ncbi:hypothetical protein KKI17_02515 [Patescibacteria group bacterium]|nr:hypothetical protein [Patescibacteria group bacterium]